MENLSKLVKVLKGQVLTPPPIWLMRQAGRYLIEYQQLRQQCPDFISFCLNPKLTIEATLQPLRRFNFDAAIVFSDILMIPYALGQSVTFIGGTGPVLQPIRTEEDINTLDSNSILMKLQPVLETLRALRHTLPLTQALIGFVGAPWTLFAYMIEGRTSRTFDHALQFCYQYPVLAQKLIDLICKSLEEFVLAQVKAGADVIQIFDSWAGIVPYPLQEKMIYQPTKRLLDYFKNYIPETPVICFPKGIGEKIPLYIRKTGAQALGLDAQVDIEQIIPNIPEDFPLQGALDPQILVCGGDMLFQEVKRLKKIMINRPYIFNLGHGIVPQTPFQNVTALINYINES